MTNIIVLAIFCQQIKLSGIYSTSSSIGLYLLNYDYVGATMSSRNKLSFFFCETQAIILRMIGNLEIQSGAESYASIKLSAQHT